MSRPRAEIIPAVTVPPRPKGFPMATTQSPTRDLSEFPNFTASKGTSDSTFNTAKSVFWSRPISQNYRNLISALDDVIVGYNVSVFTNNKTRS
jgi:hypothetical protein